MLWGHGISDHLCGLLVMDLCDDLLCGEAKWHTVIDDPQAMLHRAPLSSSPLCTSDEILDTRSLDAESVSTFTATDDTRSAVDSFRWSTPSVDRHTRTRTIERQLEASEQTNKASSHLCCLGSCASSMSSLGGYDSSDGSTGNSKSLIVPYTQTVGNKANMSAADQLGPGQLVTVNKRSLPGR